MSTSASEAGQQEDGDKESRLDSFVARRPIRTFLVVALLSCALFFLLYWATGTLHIGGYKLEDTVTNYVGDMATTMVAFAGALVSIVLASLAIRLGRQAHQTSKHANTIQENIRDLTDRQREDAQKAAEEANAIQKQMKELTERLGRESRAEAARANEIQHQMQKFSDPRLAETREGHKSASALDLLGALLCVYAAEVFSSQASDRPIEPIRHTYKRGNDLVSDPALYRYCAQLIGPSEATTRFASMQAKIYEATRLLGRDGELGRNDSIKTARNAERIAIEIAKLSRMLERAKQAVLVDHAHHLHQLAMDLKWEKPENNVSGCESTARRYLLETTVGMEAPTVDVLLRPGKRSVVHVLETDLEDLFKAIGPLVEAEKVPPEGVEAVRHGSLRNFVSAGHESRVGTRADVIIAGWDSTLKDEPRSVTYEKLYRPWDHVASAGIDLESAHLWGKATFLAKNPSFERVVTDALRDLEFLREMKLTDVSDDLYYRQGIDPAEAEDEVLDKEWRNAARSANRLRYIHAAIDDLKRIHDSRGSVVIPDRNPYEGLTQEDSDRTIIVVRPYFARIDMLVPGSEWEQKNEWFEECIGGYANYRWNGSDA